MPRKPVIPAQAGIRTFVIEVDSRPRFREDMLSRERQPVPAEAGSLKKAHWRGRLTFTGR